MRYIVSKDKLNKNIAMAQSMIGQRKLSLIFKEYYEQLHDLVSEPLSGNIFSVNIPNSICYAIGLFNKNNKGAVVNNLYDCQCLYDLGKRIFYLPVDSTDGREGLPVYDAKELSYQIKSIFPDAEVRGMITNGCINDNHFKDTNEWFGFWNEFNGTIKELSVGGSYWLNKSYLLPDFVSDIRIGRFFLFGFIPYDQLQIGHNCIKAQGTVLGINKPLKKILTDLGDAYCDPAKLYPNNRDLKLSDISSNYATFTTSEVENYRIGQKLMFDSNYKHSSAFARLNVTFDYE